MPLTTFKDKSTVKVTLDDTHLPHAPSPEVRLRVRRDGQCNRGRDTSWLLAAHCVLAGKSVVEVQQAIETERQTLRARVELDQDQLVGELLSLHREAREHRAYSAAARCLGMVAQMTGLDEPEPQVDSNLKQLFEALGDRGAG